VALPSWFCHAFAKPGYLITDPYMGSGTTMIAAEQSGRVACGTELLPAYCDVAVKRWQRLTGERATLESTGQPFPRETE
jgi:DNA modification methylase